MKNDVMPVIGFSAGGVGRDGNVDRMVRTVLENSGLESDFVKLTDLTYSGCKGCIDLCRDSRVCSLEDDLKPYYEKIKECSAVVIGSPVYFDRLTASTVCFLERFFGYRHMEGTFSGKKFVLVTSGAQAGHGLDNQLYEYIKYLDAEIAAVINYRSGNPSCPGCKRHPLWPNRRKSSGKGHRSEQCK